MIEIRKAAQAAFKNKDAISATKICSCYHCCITFEVSEIKDWTDNHLTAICPKCNVDAVLPLMVEEDHLKKIQEYWYGKLHSNSSTSGRETTS